MRIQSRDIQNSDQDKADQLSHHNIIGRWRKIRVIKTCDHPDREDQFINQGSDLCGKAFSVHEWIEGKKDKRYRA